MKKQQKCQFVLLLTLFDMLYTKSDHLSSGPFKKYVTLQSSVFQPELRSTQGCRGGVQGVTMKCWLFFYLGVPPNTEFTFLGRQETKKVEKHCTGCHFSYFFLFMNFDFNVFVRRRRSCLRVRLDFERHFHSNSFQSAKLIGL